jgi:hypothetical protein
VGAAKAADRSGEPAKAQEYYGKVVTIADAADNTGPRLPTRARF